MHIIIIRVNISGHKVTPNWCLQLFSEDTCTIIIPLFLPGPTKSALQAMLANLEGEDEMPPAQPPAQPIINVPPPVRLIGSRATAEIPPIASISVPSNVTGGGKGTAPQPTSPDIEPFESALGLGELAGLTVSNEAEALSYEVSDQISLGKKKVLVIHRDEYRE